MFKPELVMLEKIRVDWFLWKQCSKCFAKSISFNLQQSQKINIILHFTRENTESTRDETCPSSIKADNWVLKYRSVYKARVHTIIHKIFYYLYIVHYKNYVNIIQNCLYLMKVYTKKKQLEKAYIY